MHPVITLLPHSNFCFICCRNHNLIVALDLNLPHFPRVPRPGALHPVTYISIFVSFFPTSVCIRSYIHLASFRTSTKLSALTMTPNSGVMHPCSYLYLFVPHTVTTSGTAIPVRSSSLVPTPLPNPGDTPPPVTYISIFVPFFPTNVYMY